MIVKKSTGKSYAKENMPSMVKRVSTSTSFRGSKAASMNNRALAKPSTTNVRNPTQISRKSEPRPSIPKLSRDKTFDKLPNAEFNHNYRTFSENIVQADPVQSESERAEQSSANPIDMDDTLISDETMPRDLLETADWIPPCDPLMKYVYQQQIVSPSGQPEGCPRCNSLNLQEPPVKKISWTVKFCFWFLPLVTLTVTGILLALTIVLNYRQLVALWKGEPFQMPPQLGQNEFRDQSLYRRLSDWFMQILLSLFGV
ncbi:uncharacterized protein LOC129750521 [Uranotaenia lowii]|uniref:uncharacterized protein LOC129750521 n=1 Tax=Uranotaenia lowii TaxID=190385 RepID=UPI00247AA046|nr:uncharacterized protein LOC129750521 [Uranotaenia lowii]